MAEVQPSPAVLTQIKAQLLAAVENATERDLANVARKNITQSVAAMEQMIVQGQASPATMMRAMIGVLNTLAEGAKESAQQIQTAPQTIKIDSPQAAQQRAEIALAAAGRFQLLEVD